MATWRSGALLALAVTLVVAGLVAVYVRVELAEPEAFADRGVAALRSDPVRSVVAEEVAVDLLERQSPDLVAARPLVLTAVAAVLETDDFERVFRRAAVTAHGVLFQGDVDVAVELGELREVLLPALRTASPSLARQLPEDLRPQIATIRRSDIASTTTRTADRLSAAAWPLLAVGLLALLALVARAADRRRAIVAVGAAMVVASLVAVAALAALEAEVVSHARAVGVVSEPEVRSAARATWDALAGDLQRLLLVFGGLGALLCASVVLAAVRVDRERAVRRILAVLAGDRQTPIVRVQRGAGVAILGGIVVLGIPPLDRVLVVLLGTLLVLAGLTEAVSTLRTARDARPADPERRRSRRRIAIGGGLAVLVLAGAAVAVLVGRGDGPPPLRAEELSTCNGSAAICDRRLDQVVFPATHNSMSAADRPGWLFANQRRPIPRQLDDGIRLLMLDPHYGRVNSEGRVRTDLEAEGTTRNRVAAQLGSDAIGAAERLAGRLGLVPGDGERRIYLCHTLCELGAEGFGSTLREIRGWLERNRSEVLVLLLESSVAPEEIVEAVDDAGLERYLVTLDRDRPLPRMRDLITSGRRLVVLDEHDGGGAPWFQPAFLFAQNTSIGGFTKDRSTCEPGRGTPDGPLLILNNWVDRFPPPSNAAAAANEGRALRDRVRRCRERLGRAPNAIAVDFYQRGDLFDVVRDLNRAGVGREG